MCDMSDMLLSVKIGFSFVRAAVVCAVLKRISGFVLPSDKIAPKYLKLLTVLNFCHFTFE